MSKKTTLNAAAQEWKPSATTTTTTPSTTKAQNLRNDAPSFQPQAFVPPVYPQFYPQHQMPQYGYEAYGYPIHQQYGIYQHQHQQYGMPSHMGNGYQNQKRQHHAAPNQTETKSAGAPPESKPASAESLPASAESVPVNPTADETVKASSDKVEAAAVKTENAATPATESTEGPEGETGGWARGAILNVGKDTAEAASTEDVSSVSKAAPSPWKRGSSMPEKTTAHMLTRDDGIVRYSKAMMFTFNSWGKTCPQLLLDMYGTFAHTERVPSSENRSAPKSPAYKNRRNRRQEENDEPHPDEQLIFSKENLAKEGTFHYDPSKALDETETTIHKAKEILNKLSPQNFDKLSIQFMQIGMESEEMMSTIVELIVTKAQLEEPFCFMYADLCKKITDQWTAPGDEDSALGKTFRNILLSRCQEEFQQDREAAVQAIMDLELAEDDREEKLLILKQRYTGHMRFVGEIYMKDMIKANKIHFCIEILLSSREEEKLLCLCKLMQTVGKKLEDYETKKKRTTVADYFTTITDISKDKFYSSKIRFLFQDLIDMRKNNWTARRVEEKAKKVSAFRTDSPNNAAGAGNKFPGSGNNTPRVAFASPKVSGSQDARAAAAPAGDDEWSVASRKKGGKGGRAHVPTTAPSSSSNIGGLQGTTMGNKFSALGNVGNSDSPVKNSSKGGKNKHGLPMLQTTASESSDTSPAGSPLKRRDSADSQSNYPDAVGEDGKLDSHSITRVVAAMNEYFLNDLLDEAVEVMRELVHPNAMNEAVRATIVTILEKKDTERVKYNVFLAGLFSSGLLSAEQAVSGLSQFLDSYDDIVIDVPKVGDYMASVLANLYVAGALDDFSFMLTLPDENNFSLSMGIFDLIVKATVVVASLKDEGAAKELLTSTLSVKAPLGDMEQEQLAKAVEKSNAQYLV